MERLKAKIRNIPDFPEPGIQFKDITRLVKDPAALQPSTAVPVPRLSCRSSDRAGTCCRALDSQHTTRMAATPALRPGSG
jgi:hypothetical protein